MPKTNLHVDNQQNVNILKIPVIGGMNAKVPTPPTLYNKKIWAWVWVVANAGGSQPDIISADLVGQLNHSEVYRNNIFQCSLNDYRTKNVIIPTTSGPAMITGISPDDAFTYFQNSSGGTVFVYPFRLKIAADLFYIDFTLAKSLPSGQCDFGVIIEAQSE